MPDKKRLKFKLSENRGLVMMGAGLLFFVLFGCILMHLAGSATLEGVSVTAVTVLMALSLILMILGDGQRKIDRHKTERRNCFTALSLPQLLLILCAVLTAARVIAGNFSVDALQIVLSFVLFAAVLSFFAALVKSVLYPADPAEPPAAEKAAETAPKPPAAAPGGIKTSDLHITVKPTSPEPTPLNPKREKPSPEKPSPEKRALTLHCDRCGEAVNMRTLRLVDDKVYCGYCYREIFPEKKGK